MHGNEPAGIFAARQVIQYLVRRAASPFVDGLSLSGNRAALAQRCRYIGQDFNRMWTTERIAACEASDAEFSRDPEEREQRELLTAIEQHSLNIKDQ
jgi:succinylglutamate desuccinylase